MQSSLSGRRTRDGPVGFLDVFSLLGRVPKCYGSTTVASVRFVTPNSLNRPSRGRGPVVCVSSCASTVGLPLPFLVSSFCHGLEQSRVSSGREVLVTQGHPFPRAFSRHTNILWGGGEGQRHTWTRR